MLSSGSFSVLGISGSLRSQSSNGAILRAAANALVAAGADYVLFDRIGDLPYFSPEAEANNAVLQLKEAIAQADAVVIGTPEYAFGVPGALKNALDWLVFTGELNDKPVAAISSSSLYSGGDKALASLLLTLKALGTKMMEESALSVGSAGQKIQENELKDEATHQQIGALMQHLRKMAEAQAEAL